MTFGGVLLGGVPYAVQEAPQGGSLADLLETDSVLRHASADFAALSAIVTDVAAGCHFLSQCDPPVSAHLTARSVLLDVYAGRLRPKLLFQHPVQ